MSTYYSYPTPILQEELMKIANQLVQPGKGILAADESVATVGKRFQEIGVENTAENRRRYRQMLFKSKIGDYISGVILYPETLYQETEEGKTFVELLKTKGIVSGVKVDHGLVPLFGSEDSECTTQGLDDLADRCALFKRDGCHFAKWRSILKIGQVSPSLQALYDSATVLARFASICQQNRLVPIVEPEIIPEGMHSLTKAQKATEVVLAAVYKSMQDHHVFLEGTLLRANMITAGTQCPVQYKPAEIAQATVQAYQRAVPCAVMGIACLTGSLTEEEATVNLDAVNKFVGRKPWPITFAFGRGLQISAMKTWAGRDECVPSARSIFVERCRANCLATFGKYMPSNLGKKPEDEGELYIKGHCF